MCIDFVLKIELLVFLCSSMSWGDLSRNKNARDAVGHSPAGSVVIACSEWLRVSVGRPVHRAVGCLDGVGQVTGVCSTGVVMADNLRKAMDKSALETDSGGGSALAVSDSRSVVGSSTREGGVSWSGIDVYCSMRDEK
jgi:hypothetical protein